MTPRKTPSDEQLRDAFSEVGDALQRAVVLSSDRVQSVFEDAVLRGRMTRRDAEELASSLVALGRDQALELRGEVDALARSLPARVADAVDAATEVVTTTKKVKRRSKRTAAPGGDAGETPVAVADPPVAAADLPAKDLIALVPSLSTSELKALRAEESAGKARATVLRAIDAKLKA